MARPRNANEEQIELIKELWNNPVFSIANITEKTGLSKVTLRSIQNWAAFRKTKRIVRATVVKAYLN